tara:strand:+ start:2578 stop:2907 length:330 start_codon:yes stop_codon:yes gene_type:complete
MKKLILTLTVAISSLTLVAQNDNLKKTTVHFDIDKNLYLVSTDSGNWHYVTEYGQLEGPFMHTFNNIVIKGFMRNGKRHGNLTEIVGNTTNAIIKYDNGIAVQVTKFLK